MNNEAANKFINSIVKNLQLLCHSDVNFSENVEIIGHLYLNVDSNSKYNYFVNEKICKNDNSSTVFVSNSFHAEPVKKCLKDSGVKNGGEIGKDKIRSDQTKHCANSHQKKTERKSESSFSDEVDFKCKYPRLDINDKSDSSRFGKGLFEKNDDRCDFEQFNIGSSHHKNDSPASHPSSSSSSHPPDSCIDLTNIKREPSDNVDNEYIKNQQQILDEDDTSYKEDLSTFSGSNDQLLHLYSATVNHNEPHSSLNSFSQLPFSTSTHTSPQKVVFPSMSRSGHSTAKNTSKEDISSNATTRYQCPLCEKNFSFKTNVHRHIKERHFPTKVRCPICSKPFSRQGTLNDHMIHCEIQNTLT